MSTLTINSPPKPERHDRYGTYVCKTCNEAGMLMVWSKAAIKAVSKRCHGVTASEALDGIRGEMGAALAWTVKCTCSRADGVNKDWYSYNPDTMCICKSTSYSKDINALDQWCKDSPNVHHVQAATDSVMADEPTVDDSMASNPEPEQEWKPDFDPFDDTNPGEMFPRSEEY